MVIIKRLRSAFASYIQYRQRHIIAEQNARAKELSRIPPLREHENKKAFEKEKRIYESRQQRGEVFKIEIVDPWTKRRPIISGWVEATPENRFMISQMDIKEFNKTHGTHINTVSSYIWPKWSNEKLVEYSRRMELAMEYLEWHLLMESKYGKFRFTEAQINAFPYIFDSNTLAKKLFRIPEREKRMAEEFHKITQQINILVKHLKDSGIRLDDPQVFNKIIEDRIKNVEGIISGYKQKIKELEGPPPKVPPSATQKDLLETRKKEIEKVKNLLTKYEEELNKLTAKEERIDNPILEKKITQKEEHLKKLESEFFRLQEKNKKVDHILREHVTTQNEIEQLKTRRVYIESLYLNELRIDFSTLQKEFKNWKNLSYRRKQEIYYSIIQKYFKTIFNVGLIEHFWGALPRDVKNTIKKPKYDPNKLESVNSALSLLQGAWELTYEVPKKYNNLLDEDRHLTEIINNLIIKNYNKTNPFFKDIPLITNYINSIDPNIFPNTLTTKQINNLMTHTVYWKRHFLKILELRLDEKGLNEMGKVMFEDEEYGGGASPKIIKIDTKITQIQKQIIQKKPKRRKDGSLETLSTQAKQEILRLQKKLTALLKTRNEELTKLKDTEEINKLIDTQPIGYFSDMTIGTFKEKYTLNKLMSMSREEMKELREDIFGTYEERGKLFEVVFKHTYFYLENMWGADAEQIKKMVIGCFFNLIENNLRNAKIFSLEGIDINTIPIRIFDIFARKAQDTIIHSSKAKLERGEIIPTELSVLADILETEYGFTAFNKENFGTVADIHDGVIKIEDLPNMRPTTERILPQELPIKAGEVHKMTIPRENFTRIQEGTNTINIVIFDKGLPTEKKVYFSDIFGKSLDKGQIAMDAYTSRSTGGRSPEFRTEFAFIERVSTAIPGNLTRHASNPENVAYTLYCIKSTKKHLIEQRKGEGFVKLTNEEERFLYDYNEVRKGKKEFRELEIPKMTTDDYKIHYNVMETEVPFGRTFEGGLYSYAKNTRGIGKNAALKLPFISMAQERAKKREETSYQKFKEGMPLRDAQIQGSREIENTTIKITEDAKKITLRDGTPAMLIKFQRLKTQEKRKNIWETQERYFLVNFSDVKKWGIKKPDKRRRAISLRNKLIDEKFKKGNIYYTGKFDSRIIGIPSIEEASASIRQKLKISSGKSVVLYHIRSEDLNQIKTETNINVLKNTNVVYKSIEPNLQGKVVLDIETQGINKSWMSIYEISAIKFDKKSKIKSQIRIDVKPQGKWDKKALELAAHSHGKKIGEFLRDINKKDIMSGEDVNALAKFVKDKEIIGHNIKGFDWPVLKNLFTHFGEDVNVRLKDTLEMAKFNERFAGELGTKSLEKLVDFYRIKEAPAIKKMEKQKQINAHTAFGDVITTAQLFKIFRSLESIYENLGIKT